MNIDRHNFESYYIDYLEGNLPPSGQEEMRAFLLLNADLEDGTEGLEEVKLKPPILFYPGKKSRKKEGPATCPDEAAIALAESRHPSADSLNKYLTPQGQELVLFYKKLRLTPDLSVTYPGKNKLYRPRPVVWWWYKTAVAAVFLILAGIAWFHFRPATETSQPSLSRKMIPEFPPVSPATFPVCIPHSPEPPRLVSSGKRTVEKIAPLPTAKKSIPVLNQAFEPLSLTLENTATPVNLVLRQETGKVVYHPEIYLTESALTWKASENRFQPDNIFQAMIHAGRSIAEKIRNPGREE